MSKRQVPKLNIENFLAWKSIIRLHLGGIGNHAQSFIIVEPIDPVGVPTTEDMKKKKEHNQEMLEIASTLSYAKFNYIKGCTFVFNMWEALSNIYGRDQNV